MDYFVSNKMMVMIPTANIGDVGLRKLIKKEVVMYARLVKQIGLKPQ